MVVTERHQANAKIENQHDAKLHGIHAEISGHRQENRRSDDDQRRHVHEGSEQQQHDVDQ
jgi:hypothetical protein